jgi:hypothetical protein
MTHVPRPKSIARALAIGAAALALVAVAPAGAATVQFTGWNVSGPTHGPVSVAAPIGSNTSAGEFRLLIDGVPDTSFCIELTQHISLPSGVYDSFTLLAPDSPQVAGGGFDARQLARFDRLFEHYLDDARLSTASSAAFQTAVWEIAYDGRNTLALLSDNFRLRALGAPGSPGDIAAGWLATLDQQPAGGWEFRVLHSPNLQDQLIARNVPVPATTALLGIGLACGAACRAARRGGRARS